ncbi:hypothetical protein RYX36_012591, partial [Vicia faba]
VLDITDKRGEMAPKQPSTGLFVGLNKGLIVTKKDLAPRPSARKRGKQAREFTWVLDITGKRGEMAPKQPSTSLFVGLNKGRIVTKKDLAPRPSARKRGK